MGAESPLATVEDLAAVWPGYSVSDEKRAESLLEMASAAIRSLCDVSAVDGDVLRLVACKAVARMMSQEVGEPGAKQQSWSAGSYSGSVTYSNPSADFYLTQQERQLLGVGEMSAAYVGPSVPE